MATYKPYRKTDSAGTLEEIKIPYSSVDGTPTIPTKTSQLTNDSGFITSNGSVKSVIDYNDTSKNIKIGYSGAGITGNDIKYIAGYTVSDGTTGNVARIKDISKDALKSWLGYATVNDGTLNIQKNGETVATFTANQSTNVTANITVPTKASDVNALSLDGGTINKSKTVKMDASANSDGANLKWGTVNSRNPYIGYASDQVDGTFVVGSLLGTNFASGLAIGGGSGNLLWKGAKVATTSDIPNVSGKANLSGGNTFSGNQYVRNGWIGDESCFCAFNYTGAHPELDISDNALVQLDNGYGEDGQVFTSQGETGPPHWTTPAIKSATLSGTTLTITLP